MEQFICDRIREMFITNEDGMQNIRGLSVSAVTTTKDWNSRKAVLSRYYQGREETITVIKNS